MVVRVSPCRPPYQKVTLMGPLAESSAFTGQSGRLLAVTFEPESAESADLPGPPHAASKATARTAARGSRSRWDMGFSCRVLRGVVGVRQIMAQPFTAPAVRPRTMVRWKMIRITRIG